MKILSPLKVPFDQETAEMSTQLAKITDAELEFLNVIDTTPFKGHIKVKERFLEFSREDAEILLEPAKNVAKDGGVVAKSTIVEGKPFDAILKAGENVDMLVLKIRRFSIYNSIGTITNKVLESCKKPVYVFKGGKREINKILLAIDESECSEEATKFSLTFSNYLGVKNVSAVYVARSDDKMKAGEETLEGVKKHGEDFGIEIETHLLRGDPTKEILGLSEKGFDLIIMGAVGTDRLTKFFFGSVSRKVTNFSTCDVIVIPPCR